MTRKKDDFENDDYKVYTMDGNLEQRVKAWVKYADFRHVTTSPCSKCGKGMYAFTPEDTDGFCTNCFNQRWITPKHKRGHAGLGANANKKQKSKNVEEQQAK
jgi:hypothetical protein